MTTRRTFLKTMSAATALSIVSPTELFAMKKKKYIGIQLYTIRERLKKDFVGTMMKVADIGYTSVETAGYNDKKFYGYSPKDFKIFTRDLGLQALSSHANIELKNIDQTIDDTLEAGMEYLVKPWLDSSKYQTIDTYKKLADEFNIIGEKCNASGLRFAYHNHAFEFNEIENQLPYDVLLANTQADLMCMQLDTYWMIYGGYQPLDYFKKYPGRFELFHIKDMDDTPERESTEIGTGIINFQEIFEAQKLSGMKYFFLEQEAFKMDEFKSLAISFNYLKTL